MYEPATYRTIAEATGLDADAIVAAFEAPASQAAAEADFRRSAQLGVTGFPTLLARRRRPGHRSGHRPRYRRRPLSAS